MYGGVDLTAIPRLKLSTAAFTSGHQTLPATVRQAVLSITGDAGGKLVWLGGESTAQPLPLLQAGLASPLLAPDSGWSRCCRCSSGWLAARCCWAAADGMAAWPRPRRRRWCPDGYRRGSQSRRGVHPHPVLAGVAAARVTAGLGAFYALPQISRYYSDSHGDGDFGAAAGLDLVLAAVVSLLAGGLYLLLAVLNTRGLNPVRVITWIASALTVVYTASTLVLDLYHAVPWYSRLTVTTDTVTLLLTVAATVLLAVPPAHRFYQARRRARPAPPTPPSLPNPPGPGFHPSP